MPNPLLDKIKAARQSQYVVDGHIFTIRRPTDLEMATLGGTPMHKVAERFVCGWDLKELDVIPGGTGVSLSFDAELYAEWLQDQPSLWVPLAEAILALYQQHAARREESLKKPEPG